MSRKMVSPEQLEKKIDDKIKGYDAAIPTDLAESNGRLYLYHDGIKLESTGWVVPHYFIHYIKCEGANGATCVINFTSRSNLIVDSFQDLNTLIGVISKPIITSNGFIDWKGSFAATSSLSNFTKVSDIVEAL